MTVGQVKEALGLEEVCRGDLEKEVTGCYMGDLLSWVMGRAQPGDLWITIMTNLNMVAVAVLADVACVLIPEDCGVDPAALQKAQAQEVTILKSEKSAYDLAVALSKLL